MVGSSFFFSSMKRVISIKLIRKVTESGREQRVLTEFTVNSVRRSRNLDGKILYDRGKE